MSATPGTSTSNWRLVPKDADEYRSHLVERTSWSQDQYKESLQLYERLLSCKDSYVSPAIQSALNTLDHAYRLYGPNSVICSFNGGKDAVVILHLVRAIHAKYYNSTGETPIRPRSVYFNNDNEFSEVTSFLEESVDTYDLDMIAFEHGIGFAAGLDILVKNNFVQGAAETALPMAFVLGTRESDPNAKGQDSFCPSSHWMPPFMRVNPVLNWNYGLVWHFLRLFELPYCSLYDQGYTSLGTTKDTHPCPALAVNRGDDNTVGTIANNVPKFWPAYMLVDWDQERAGRVKKEKPADKNNASTIKKDFDRSNSGLTAVSDQRVQKSLLKNSEVLSDNNATQDDGTVLTLGTEELNEFGGEAKTVGIIVVGDEILKGMTTDTNTQTAARALRKECLLLSRVVVVSDDVDEITKEIRRLRNEVDVVITSGGVGPTHDDVTIKGVAEALDKELLYNEEMAKLLKKKMNTDGVSSNTSNKELTSAQIKMATLPSNAKLRYLSTDEWPVLQCRNVFILPGVPEFFAKKIENVATYLSSQLERSIVMRIVLNVDEQCIVEVLNNAVKNHPKVSMGSYPFVSHPEFKTVVTLEADLVDSSTHQFTNINNHEGVKASRNSLFLGRDAVILPKEVRDRNVRLALDDLISELPKGSILRVENDDLDPFM